MCSKMCRAVARAVRSLSDTKGNNTIVNRALIGPRQLILKVPGRTCAAFYTIYFMGFLIIAKGRELIESSRCKNTSEKISNTRSTLFNKYGHGREITRLQFFDMNS